MNTIIERCSRCGGNLFWNDGEIECIQCGYQLPSKKEKGSLVKVFRWQNLETLTGKNLQETY